MHLNHPLEPRNPGHQVNSPAHRVGSLEPPVSSPAHRASSLVLQENSPEPRKLLKATRLLMPTSLLRGTNLPKDMNPRKSRNRVKNRHSDNFQILPQKSSACQAGAKQAKEVERSHTALSSLLPETPVNSTTWRLQRP